MSKLEILDWVTTPRSRDDSLISLDWLTAKLQAYPSEVNHRVIRLGLGHVASSWPAGRHVLVVWTGAKLVPDDALADAIAEKYAADHAADPNDPVADDILRAFGDLLQELVPGWQLTYSAYFNPGAMARQLYLRVQCGEAQIGNIIRNDAVFTLFPASGICGFDGSKPKPPSLKFDIADPQSIPALVSAILAAAAPTTQQVDLLDATTPIVATCAGMHLPHIKDSISCESTGSGARTHTNASTATTVTTTQSGPKSASGMRSATRPRQR